MTDELRAALKLVQEAGYLVAKIPECKLGGRDHGSHTLITRSARCPGGGTIPHGLHSWHLGTFGMWANCKCGGSFSDYYGSEDDPSNWEKHKAEHPEFFGQSTKDGDEK